MLPHVLGRPLTLDRRPDGVGKKRWFQKETPAYFPAWIERAELPKRKGTIRHALVKNAAGLTYLGTQGTLALHVWTSRADRPRHPDRLVFDLDPSTDDFTLVLDAARDLRTLLEVELGLAAFVMATGSRGLHVVVPIVRAAETSAVRRFAQQASQVLVRRRPDRYTLEFHKAKRGDRLYLDVLRNGYAQTVVAPYSPRALPRASVATPLGWEELDDPGLAPDGFDLHAVLARVEARGDPWHGIGRHARALDSPARKIQALLD